MARHYRRHLPHIDAPGAWNFVTWRLEGSMPPGRHFIEPEISSGRQFVAYDRLLDAAKHGPKYLGNPSVAAAVRERLLSSEHEELCAIDTFVIMPNHVHVLWRPKISLPKLMRYVKGGSARFANQILQREGPFWQREYFDRLVRNQEEFQRIRRYIEQNPVHAGLSATPETWAWSSAAARPASLKARAG